MSIDNSNYDVYLQLDSPIPQSSVKVIFNREKFDPKSSNQLDILNNIQQTWLKRVQDNPKLFNALKFRLYAVRINSNNKIEMDIGITDYATFLGTNRNSDLKFIESLEKEGLERFDDKFALFANPFGNAAVILTSDGYIPLLQRSFQTAEFAGWWDVPGGHAEPSRIEAELKQDEGCEQAILNEIFDSVRDEVRTELNVPFEVMINTSLVGIVRAHASNGKPSAIFLIPLSITAEQVAELYRQGGEEADESKMLTFISKHDKHGKLSFTISQEQDEKIEKPLHFEDIQTKVVPTATFALEFINKITPTPLF